ncbi:MMPL family transporter [Picrophilus oshimae]|uniref:Putative drug exporter of the RND superfamily n=1 Tax=Picrophilus torridus (strain ATCC 700027 / DSM 9790 / JCM 10055 / NBRC 100828 / KAW 2/3) TaxID=1122961 RepID=A0A8G2FWT7_PICTO|nr:MMPL family transporter [Picrophilus oshimae]SMD30916.1 putative drug exporter of the RND superfamily [Picrophilus oshimae DSM 9789]
MFENFFHSVGSFSRKHRKALIAFWIVIFILMLPFAEQFFNDTSYNISSSIITKNSMAYKANSLLESQFNGSDPNELIVVVNNTNIDNLTVNQNMINFENSLKDYMEKQKIDFINITSIITTENKTLLSFSRGIYSEENSTYNLMMKLHNETTSLLNQSGSLVRLEFGLPLEYLLIFEKTNNNTIAYKDVSTGLKGLPLIYLNYLSGYWNSTIKNLNNSNAIYIMNNAINSTVSNRAFEKILNSTLMLDLSRNYTLYEYYKDPENINSSLPGFSVSYVSNAIKSNKNATKFIEDDLCISPYKFVYKSFNVSEPVSFKMITPMVSIIYNASIKIFKNDPFIMINNGSYKWYLYSLYNTSGKNIGSFVYGNSGILKNYPYNEYPVLPSNYVKNSLLGYNNSTLLFIIDYKGNLTASEINGINHITSRYASIIPNSKYYLAGNTVADSELGTEVINGLVIALLIGISISIVIVGVFFRSPVAAFIPLLVFILSAVITAGISGIIYKYIFHSSISFITPTLLMILLLGISSDYTVYILSRYRSELKGKNMEASQETAKWAGLAVFTSGTTVAISYIVLWLSGIPIFSDDGLTNALGALIAITIANTFLIALTALLGKRAYWPSRFEEKKRLPFESSMTRIAGFTLKNRKKLIVLFIILTIAGLYVYSVTPTNMDVFTLLPPSSGIESLVVVNDSFHYDLFDPSYIIVNFTSPIVSHGKYNETEYNEIVNIEKRLLENSDVHSVLGIGYPFGYYVNYSFLSSDNRYVGNYINQTNSYIGKNPRYAEIVIYLSNIAWSGQSTKFVNEMPSIAGNGNNYKVYVGGLTEYLNDAYSFTSASFEKMIPILAASVFIILLLQIASAFTPVRLILMVMASVIVSLSVTYAIFYYTLHLPIIIFLPLFVFITLLAVGLDYDIFMVTKAREGVIKGLSNDEAIKQSIIQNGGVIITLGSLLFVTFGALYFSGIGIMQEIGIGLALGVLIDTFISWPFFVPSIMLYLDKYNWWPSKIGRNKK